MQPILISEILKQKGNEVFTVKLNQTAFEALQILADKDVGALMVMDGDNLAGIFSERDYARRIILKGKSSKEVSVEEVMSTNIQTITSKTKISECMTIFTDKHIRHLPVLEGGKVVGVISIGDIVKKIIEAQAKEIDQLGDYIKSGG